MVSDLTKERWSAVWEMNIYEFFNYLTYTLEDKRREVARINEAKGRKVY